MRSRREEILTKTTTMTTPTAMVATRQGERGRTGLDFRVKGEAVPAHDKPEKARLRENEKSRYTRKLPPIERSRQRRREKREREKELLATHVTHGARDNFARITSSCQRAVSLPVRGRNAFPLFPTNAVIIKNFIREER